MQAFGRARVITVLADDLLRVFANRFQRRVLYSLGIAREAQNQGFQGFLRGLGTFFWSLTGDRFPNLIQTGQNFGVTGQAKK